MQAEDQRRCTAHARSGDRCRSIAIRGGNVCRMHGGGAPQVKRAAEDRLRDLVDPAIAELTRIATRSVDSKSPDDTRLAAIREIFDRVYGKPKQAVDLKNMIELVTRVHDADLSLIEPDGLS